MLSAFLFPGQGSQSVGMLSPLAKEYPSIVRIYEQASDVLGYDVWKLVQAGPAEILNQTEKTQPALLAAGVALFEIWQARVDKMPDFMAGHSLGEYTALVCAGALDYGDALSLVALRGRLMQAAVPEGEGGMAAIIGLSDDHVAALCTEVAAAQEQVVSCANFNTAGQVVVSGHRLAVDRALTLSKSRGAKLAKKIPVSVPSHCILMRPAAAELASYLQAVPIQKPRVPVIHNVDANVHHDPQAIRLALVDQLSSPVLWVKSVHSMIDSGVRYFAECGPGRVLTGLCKRISKEVAIAPMGTPDGLKAVMVHYMGMS